MKHKSGDTANIRIRTQKTIVDTFIKQIDGKTKFKFKSGFVNIAVRRENNFFYVIIRENLICFQEKCLLYKHILRTAGLSLRKYIYDAQE